MPEMILRCPDPECWTTYDASVDPDGAFGDMVNHYQLNMRHNDGKLWHAAALAVSERNAGLADV